MQKTSGRAECEPAIPESGRRPANRLVRPPLVTDVMEAPETC